MVSMSPKRPFSNPKKKKVELTLSLQNNLPSASENGEAEEGLPWERSDLSGAKGSCPLKASMFARALETRPVAWELPD